MLVRVLIWALVLYGMVVLFGVVVQRRLLYRIEPAYVTPQASGLVGVEEVAIEAPDGARVLAWYGKAKPGKPTLLYFHGNGGSLAVRAPRIERFMAEGWGILLMTYRGYGGSTGKPTERDNIADGVRAYDRLLSLGVAAGDIVLYGESLGTGVASRVALQRRPAGMILDAPFTSIPDVAAPHFWYLPVQLIMRDRYDTKRIIPSIQTPLLILHGTLDATVPVAMGRALAALAQEPKTFVELPRAGHSNLYTDGNAGLAAVRTFIDGLKR